MRGDENFSNHLATTLTSNFLVEIGRVMAHHGLLVSSVREFVTFVATQSLGLPASVGSEESIELLPRAIEIIKPAFPATERSLLADALDKVAKAQDLLDRFRYSTWGSGFEGVDNLVTRSEFRRYRGLGCRLDHTGYSTKDLNELAIELSLAALTVRKAHGKLAERISEEPHKLRKQFNRAQSSRFAPRATYDSSQ